MQDYCGEFHSKETLGLGLEWLDSIARSEAGAICARNPHELMRSLEVDVRLEVGRAMMHASLARRASSESLGFKRIDFPEADRRMAQVDRHPAGWRPGSDARPRSRLPRLRRTRRTPDRTTWSIAAYERHDERGGAQGRQPQTPCAAITIDAGVCTGCNRCVEVCRCDVLVPSANKGQPPEVLYPDECWFCGCCAGDCPTAGPSQ